MQASSNEDHPSSWTDEEWIDTLSDPFPIGLDDFAPAVPVDAFAKAVVEVIKFVGPRDYFARCYDKIIGHVGPIPDLGTRSDFVEKQVKVLYDAPSELEAAKSFLVGLQRLIPPRTPTPLIYIVDIVTTTDIMQALTYDSCDEALEICEVICCICGGAFWEELPDGKYVVKAPDGSYLCEMIPGNPDEEDEDAFEFEELEDEEAVNEEPVN